MQETIANFFGADSYTDVVIVVLLAVIAYLLNSIRGYLKAIHFIQNTDFRDRRGLDQD